MELADTSAWRSRHRESRHRDASVQAAFDASVLASQIATCSMVVLKLLWTAQTRAQFAELRDDLDALPQLPITPATWERSIEIWHELIKRGRHRQVKPADLLIAATAELAGVGLCHYDADFEAIAQITGQPVRPIAPLGSL